MKYLQIPLVFLLALLLVSAATPATPVAVASVLQDPTTQPATQTGALERGYRTGYSDGYSAGARDLANHAARDYRSDEDYQRADRNYNEAWGTADDYRDGYQQGFESGYGSGYDRRPFESSIPAGLSRRGNVNTGGMQPAQADSEQSSNQGAPTNSSTQNNSNWPPQGNSSQGNGSDPSSSPANNFPSGPLSIPRDAVLLVELESSLSSDASQRGDRFQARVVDPREFQGATVEGIVASVKRPGKVKGTAQMQLKFEKISLPDGRTAPLNADVIELINLNNSDGSVDSEGGVKGKDSTKDDVARVGAGAGVGAIIGAIFGGAKGAAIGAVIGGSVGAGSVLTKRGDDVRLDRGQQMRIRTATDTRIQ